MSVNERIEEQLSSHNVLLYMKGSPDFPQCGFSGQAVAALNAIGKPYAFVNIFEDPEIREGLKVFSNWPTFPQLYVAGELIGGCDIALELYENIVQLHEFHVGVPADFELCDPHRLKL